MKAGTHDRVFLGGIGLIIGGLFVPLIGDGAIVISCGLVRFVGCAAGFSRISMDDRAPTRISVNNGP